MEIGESIPIGMLSPFMFRNYSPVLNFWNFLSIFQLLFRHPFQPGDNR